MVDLEHPLHLSLGDERDGVVAGEILTRQPGREERTDLLLVQGRDGDRAPFEGGGAGIALPDHDRGGRQVVGAEAMPGGKLEHARALVEQQDIGGVHAQLAGDLAQDDRQDDVQVEAGVDGGVDGMQGRQALQVVAHLLGGVDALGHVADDGDQAALHGGHQAGFEPALSLRTLELVVQRDHVAGLQGFLE